MTRQPVSVRCNNPRDSMLPIWAALEELVAVRFSFDQQAEEFATQPLILLERDESWISRAALAGHPVFTFAGLKSDGETFTGPVIFNRDTMLDGRIRGRTVRHENIHDFVPLIPGPEDTVLAHFGKNPIWVCRKGTRIHLSGVAFPNFRDGEFPFDYLNGSRFIHLLPLLHFLRQIVGGDWQPPALRACLMFDDPNLHWSSYGFLPFREATLLAKQFNFHVACATVPLDSWYVHEPTAALFRQNPECISLLIHGNDHVSQELGRLYGDDGEVKLLAQALRRIERLEKRAGFHIPRVMAPPHGACRPGMATGMLALGFDGACISPWSLRDWGGEHQWHKAFGLQMAEMVAQFPVVPRFRMHADCEGWIIVNAFLNRPIIPVGHHDSVSEGLDLLVQLAGIVNSLPNVRWCNMEQILLSNYFVQRSGSTLSIRPFTARFRISVPSGVTTLRFESEMAAGPSEWCSSSNCDETGETEFQVQSGSTVEFHLKGWCRKNYRDVQTVRSSLWAPVRRILCEARDRVRPVVFRPKRAN